MYVYICIHTYIHTYIHMYEQVWCAIHDASIYIPHSTFNTRKNGTNTDLLLRQESIGLARLPDTRILFNVLVVARKGDAAPESPMHSNLANFLKRQFSTYFLS